MGEIGNLEENRRCKLLFQRVEFDVDESLERNRQIRFLNQDNRISRATKLLTSDR